MRKNKNILKIIVGILTILMCVSSIEYVYGTGIGIPR